ncbi:MAG: fasciclin domain-containing protein [Alphaproteobacteria bacterium]|nr:fasciclin domain-containing protein [Alphaproteobacteria bacterium]
MKYPFAAAAIAALLAGDATPAYAANSKVENALAHQGEVSMFYQALLNTGVASELSENTEYSVFAPTNAALARIQPREYPCFYAVQCRREVAAILRNNIVPKNETINQFSKWGGNPIPTIGSRGLYVEETYKDQYTVDDLAVLYQSEGNEASLYLIDGVIASSQELTAFRAQPVSALPHAVTERTVTTYRTPVSYYHNGYGVPGGYSPESPAVYKDFDTYSDGATETTTVTHTTTEQGE